MQDFEAQDHHLGKLDEASQGHTVNDAATCSRTEAEVASGTAVEIAEAGEGDLDLAFVAS